MLLWTCCVLCGVNRVFPQPARLEARHRLEPPRPASGNRRGRRAFSLEQERPAVILIGALKEEVVVREVVFILERAEVRCHIKYREPMR